MKQKSSQNNHLSGTTTGNKKNPHSLDSVNQISLGFKEVVDQWSQSVEALGKHFQQIISESSNLLQQAISQKVQETATAIVQPITDVLQHIRNVDPAFLEAVKQKIDQVLSDSKLVYPRLARRGWFLVASERIPGADMITLALHLETGTEKVDEFMTKWVEEKRVVIQEILTEKYPARKEVLECAFRAHDAGDYILSIPIFLAQSDGIYIELTGCKGGVYSVKRQEHGKPPEPRSRDVIDKLGIEQALLYLYEPLTMITALSEDDTKITKIDPTLLNRHNVLHGKRCDYGTKLNSLKAVSWLLYVGTFMDDIRD